MRMYTVSFENVAVAAAQDFFEITPADDKPVQIFGWNIENVGGTADASDAQEEFWRLAVVRGNTVSGSGGSAPTPQPCLFSDAAAGFAAEANNTTIANTSGVTIWTGGMNVRVAPNPFWLPGECLLGASQANTTIVLRLLSTPADSIQISGTLWVAELV